MFLFAVSFCLEEGRQFGCALIFGSLGLQQLFHEQIILSIIYFFIEAHSFHNHMTCTRLAFLYIWQRYKEEKCNTYLKITTINCLSKIDLNWRSERYTIIFRSLFAIRLAP